MEYHEIANIFPLMQGQAFDDFLADIVNNGIREPVWVFEGKILDGRNRHAAAKIARLKVEIREFIGSRQEALQFVWSLNFARRHLNSSQSSLADSKRNLLQNAYAEIREAAKERQLSGKKQNTDLVQLVAQGDRTQKTRDIRAKSAGTNHQYIDITDRIVATRPDLVTAIESGEMTVSRARRELKKEELSSRIEAFPDDKYRIIYADPPWSYNDKCDDGSVQSGGAELHYPSMSVADISNMGIPAITQDNAVLFLWATSPLLPDALKVASAWGFTYKASFVWDKVKHNMGHYNSVRHEFLLICTKGSCTPDNVKLFDSVQVIEKTKNHSEKPEEFRVIIDTIYPHGSRIELFRRGNAPEGWKVWGNESCLNME